MMTADLIAYLTQGCPRFLAERCLHPDTLISSEAKAEWECLAALRQYGLDGPHPGSLQFFLEHCYPRRYSIRVKQEVDDEMVWLLGRAKQALDEDAYRKLVEELGKD